MDYKFFYTNAAERDLAFLPKKDATRILKKMDQYANRTDPMKFARKLKGIKTAAYRFRVGDYRVIFRLDKKTNKLVILVVLKIALRKDVYFSHPHPKLSHKS